MHLRFKPESAAKNESQGVRKERTKRARPILSLSESFFKVLVDVYNR